MAPPKSSKAKRREDKTLRRVRVRSGIRLKGSAERERVRALKAARLKESEKSRLRESERSTSHGANTLTEVKPVPTPSQSSRCAHEDTHAHQERVRLAPRSRGWKISNLEGGGGGYLQRISSLWYNLTKKVVFLTVAGFGIFGHHKILGASRSCARDKACARNQDTIRDGSCARSKTHA